MSDAVERVKAVLAVLAQKPEGASVADVARSLCFSRASASRLLALMARSSLAERDPASQRFVPGLSLWPLAAASLRRLDILDVSLVPMAEAVKNHKLTLLLGVNRGATTFFLRQVEWVRDFVMVQPMSRLTPVHGCATGKAVLAFDSEANLEAVLGQPLAPVGNVSVSHEELLQDLERIRARGFARRNFEPQSRSDIRGLAVPIFDRSGRAVAGLGVNVPPEDEFEDRALPVLKEAAESISRSLGFSRSDATSPP